MKQQPTGGYHACCGNTIIFTQTNNRYKSNVINTLTQVSYAFQISFTEEITHIRNKNNILQVHYQMT